MNCINWSISNEETSMHMETPDNNIEEYSSHDEDESNVENESGMVIGHSYNAFHNMQVSIMMNMVCIEIFIYSTWSFSIYRIYSGTGISQISTSV